MKKVIYTLSFLAVFAVAGKAQSVATPKQEPKKELKEGSDNSNAQQAPKKKPDAAAPATDKAKGSGTRMAINEKGVPSTKPAPKDKKEEKAADPGQPATEKK